MALLADYPQLVVLLVLAPALLWFWLAHRNSDAGDSQIVDAPGAFTVRVGARVGWIRASWPLASLAVSKTGMRLSMLDTHYVFTPAEVVRLEDVGIPFLSASIRTVHSHSDYPEKIEFWYLGSVDRLLARISDAGFHATAPVESAGGTKGFPVRWSVVVVLVILWNGLMFLDFGFERREPGIATLLGVALLFFFAWSLRVSEWVQAIALREGHSIGEIKAPLRVIQLITGAAVLGIAITYLLRTLGFA